MEDGSEICCDEDLIPEVVEGKVLICCERFQDYVAENDLKGNSFIIYSRLLEEKRVAETGLI